MTWPLGPSQCETTTSRLNAVSASAVLGRLLVGKPGRDSKPRPQTLSPYPQRVSSQQYQPLATEHQRLEWTKGFITFIFSLNHYSSPWGACVISQFADWKSEAQADWVICLVCVECQDSKPLHLGKQGPFDGRFNLWGREWMHIEESGQCKGRADIPGCVSGVRNPW